jgi:PleD family two-component response regulator
VRLTATAGSFRFFGQGYRHRAKRPTPRETESFVLVNVEQVRVIVAEDDPVSREVVCTLLRKWGFEVLVTQNGTEALEALRAQRSPTLAVLDWMMPEMDGVEVCRCVREMADGKS